MPWQEVTKMSSKLEFVHFALEEKHTFKSLCERFQISRKTGYKLLKRYQEEGKSGLEERSRRPHQSPEKTGSGLEEKIIEVRKSKPYWGGRKIRAWLLNQGEKELPATSTITDILHRNGCIEAKETEQRLRLKRFEHELPNDLWQVDFKGHVEMRKGRCHPLTVLDDHSRFSIGLRACLNERGETIKPHFEEIFETYGLPWRINFDNGSPWGNRRSRYTKFSIWLMRLGIRVSYSRPCHPQTNGKDERFHRTLKRELLQYYCFKDEKEAQRYFDNWREEYNLERPHEALEMQPPKSRYRVSERGYPTQLLPIEYPESDEVCCVNKAGNISYKHKKYFIGEGFEGLPVGIRECEDGKYNVYFCHQKIRCLDLREQE